MTLKSVRSYLAAKGQVRVNEVNIGGGGVEYGPEGSILIKELQKWQVYVCTIILLCIQ